MRTWARIGLAGGVALLLAACDPGPPLSAIGVTPSDGDGQVEVLYVPCDGEHVNQVRLVRPVGAVLGDDDDKILWQIDANDANPQDTFVVGVTPPGWREVVPMSVELDPADQVAALITTNVADTFVTFALKDLKDGGVFSDGDSLTPSEFHARGESLCATPG